MKRWRTFLNSFFNDLSFTKKFILLFLFGIAIPVLIQNLVYYNQTEKNIQEEMLIKAEEAMEDKAGKLRSSLSGILSLSGNYSNNESLYHYLDHQYDRDLEYLIRYQEALKALFSEASLQSYEVGNVLIYTDNDTLFNGSCVRKLEQIDPETLGETLEYVNLEPLSGDNGLYLRVAYGSGRIEQAHDGRSVSIVGRLDHYRQYATYEKLLRIDLDLVYLKEVLQESNLFENMFLADTGGSVIAAANSYPNSGRMGLFEGEAADSMKDKIVLSKKLGEFPLTLYGVYDGNIISQQLRHSAYVSVGVSAVCLLFALAYVTAVAGNINRRLSRLVGQSKEIAKGNFVQSTSENTGKDELGVLEDSVNQMSGQLKELIEKEYKSQILQAQKEKETNQARLLALQSQVNPHFMFNALESIRLKAMVKGETETAQMIRYMAKMFRNLLQWEDNIITLREEIQFLDEFLHIQSYRFGDEFSYEIAVSEAAYDCRIPKMMLQPLVENACVHGVEALTDDRWVSLSAKTESGWLEIRVEDNGGGMSKEKLEELKNMLRGEKKATKSVGLWNVYRRLVLYYGDGFQFDIDSVPGKGTLCSIRLPVELVKESEKV